MSFFIGIISWKGVLLFDREGFIFKYMCVGWGEGAPWGASTLMGGFQNKSWDRGHPPCPPLPLPLWETLEYMQLEEHFLELSASWSYNTQLDYWEETGLCLKCLKSILGSCCILTNSLTCNVYCLPICLITG